MPKSLRASSNWGRIKAPHRKRGRNVVFFIGTLLPHHPTERLSASREQAALRCSSRRSNQVLSVHTLSARFSRALVSQILLRYFCGNGVGGCSKARTCEEGAHHGHHGPGWLLPHGVPAQQGLRGARHHPPLLQFQHAAPRTCVHRPPPVQLAHEAALRRPVGRVGTAQVGRLHLPRRGVQPRGAVARGRVVRESRLHRRRGGHGSAAPAGGSPHPHCIHRQTSEVLPGGVVGDVRRDAASARREHGVPPAQPVRRGEGGGAPLHRQLPRGVRHVRVQRHPIQPRVAPARRELRDQEDHARHRPHQGRAPEEAVPGQPEGVARLGLRGGLCGGDVVDAAAGQARRLCAGDGGLAHGGGVSGGVVRLRGAQLEGPCGDRPQVLPAVGGGQSTGIGSEGEGGVGVGAESAVQAAGGDDGGRGLGEGEAREGASGRRLHRLPPTALNHWQWYPCFVSCHGKSISLRDVDSFVYNDTCGKLVVN